MGGDGQVTVGNSIMKGDATKIRSLMDGKVLVGFAGATADVSELGADREVDAEHGLGPRLLYDNSVSLTRRRSPPRARKSCGEPRLSAFPSAPPVVNGESLAMRRTSPRASHLQQRE